MNHQMLLTILVPTYNRAANLALLLQTLRQEIGLLDTVCVLVSDNASTDQTPEVIASALAAWPGLQVQRHETNIGADGNFCSCVERVQTPYFWIIGDDDLPRTGLIPQLCALLADQQPDLVYLPSRWLPHITSANQLGSLNRLECTRLDAISFATQVNTWFTFISSNIVNLDTYRKHCSDAMARTYIGSSLVQLAWVLKVLQHGNRFLAINDTCILATSGNTGGYQVLAVFGVNFPRLVKELLSTHPDIVNTIIGRYVRIYLPSLIWQIRFANIGRFHAEEAGQAMRKQLGSYWFYWMVLRPIMRFPKAAAWPFYAAARLLGKLLSFNRCPWRSKPNGYFI